MRKRVGFWVSALAAASLLVAAAPAAAASEFGDACVGNNTPASPPAVAVFEVSNPENPLPTAAPISGVLTRWGMNVVNEPGLLLPLDLKVLRVTPGSPGSAITVGEARGTVTGGANSFAARIPIQAGDRIATTSPHFGPIICDAAEGIVGLTLSSVVGGAPVFAAEGPEKFRVPLTAVVEPDGDGDGYGDETQDGCPQSALYHEACPVITLDTIDLASGKAATVLVATSLTAAVKVTGTVKLGKGGKATLSAKAKTVTAGKYGRFKLSFPSKLRQALAELPADKKLTLKVRASAANVTGPESRDASTLKLKGQAK